MKTPFFTGKGDSGESRFGDVSLSKASIAAELLGSLDELNSCLGFCRAASDGAGEIDMNRELKNLQNSVFTAQAEFAAIVFEIEKNNKKISSEIAEKMEALILKIDEITPPLKNFVLPGGCEFAARLDLARTVARRAERNAKRFAETNRPLSPEFMKFLNRMSSVLFAIARYANFKADIKEEPPEYR